MQRGLEAHTGIWVASAIGLSTALMLLLGGALRRAGDTPPPDSQPERRAPPSQDIWVARLDSGLIGLLTGVHGDPEVDEAHDGKMRALLRDGVEGLSFARLVLFNLGSEAAAFEPSVTGLEVASAADARSRLRALKPEETEDRARDQLEALGSLSARIEIPAGSMANMVVPLDGPARIDSAEAIETAGGTAFMRRRMTRGELRALITHPRSDLIEDLLSK